MKLKTIEVEGTEYAEIKDGKPVYLGEGDKEHTYDAPAMRKTLDKINADLKSTREAKAELEKQVEAFSGIDPERAAKAIETLKNLDDKKLVDAGEIDRVKAEAVEAANNQWKKKYEDLEARFDKTETQYKSEKISNAFRGSKYVEDHLAIPPDIAQSAFGKYFTFKDGRITPVDSNGNPIYSESNPGDIATVDEALEKLVEQYPHRDRILKGTGNSGSGAGPVEEGGKRVIRRSDFEKMVPQKQAEAAAAAREGKVRISD